MLLQDLRRMSPAPAAAWHSFGFNAKENWREDGFSVSYRLEDAKRGGREAVLSLARKYDQAAIYEYQCVDGRLERAVVWCDPAQHAARGKEIERMEVLLEAPNSELSKVRWHGSA